MNFFKTSLFCVVVLAFISCGSVETSSDGGNSGDGEGGASTDWAKTVTGGTLESGFLDVAVDTSGNIYTVGAFYGTGDYNFGNGTVNGQADDNNAVIVKYNSVGTAQWAKTVTAGNGASIFSGVSIDTSNNIYVVGDIEGTGDTNFGSGVVNGQADGDNAVIVKYNSAGTAQWTKIATQGDSGSAFEAVSVDTSGNVYAVGAIAGPEDYNFGSGPVNGQADGHNAVIVKYNSAGTAQWTNTPTESHGGTEFWALSVDTLGNIYVLGNIEGTGDCNFGNGVVNGQADDNNAVIVKYNSAGTAQWARTVTEGDGGSGFWALSVDTSGNVYAVGYIQGTGDYNFGSGTVAGTADDKNAFIMKYNSAGTAQWVRTVTEGDTSSFFNDVSVDTSGNLYAVGAYYGTGDYDFGNGTVNGQADVFNAVMVEYNSAGTAQWVRTVTEGDGESVFWALSVDAADNIYAVGYIQGTGDYNFGSDTLAGTSDDPNAVIVKYVSE